jgi:AcrR family transcriptional regulator
MTIQDILGDLGMSSGAFYYYFDSKPAVLEAFIERIRQAVEQPLLPIVHDPHMPALEKHQHFFDTLDRLRIAHKADVVKLGHVWYTDDNAIVRQKVDEAAVKQRDELRRIEAIVTTHAAYMDALKRVVGAPALRYIVPTPKR